METSLVNDELWAERGGTAVSGGGFLDGQFLGAEELATEVAAIDTKGELRRLLTRLNGFFCLVHEAGDSVYLAADHVRSWPLFYAVTDDVYVSDSPQWVHDTGATRGYDPVAATEYLFTCYVPGRGTLSRDVKQVQAGELVTLQDGPELTMDRDRYFAHAPSERAEPVNRSDLDGALEQACARLVEYADGRTLLLGLSGGYDSRLVALLLHRLGYDDTVAYTTQVASGDSGEMTTAAALASDLGFEHVEVTSDRSDYGDIEGATQMDLVGDLGYLSEYPHINKVVLRRKLRERGIDPGEVVHVLGHHVLGGGTFVPDWVRGKEMLSREEFMDVLWDVHYSAWETPDRPRWRRLFEGRLLERLPTDLYRGSDVEPVAEAVSGLEQWYWQERLPKYVLARREYEYLGFDMWYPLLDRELYSFFEASHHPERVGKKVLKSYVRKLDAEVRGSESDLAGSDSDDSETVTDVAWRRTVQLVHGLPDPATEFIRGQYNAYRSKDAYGRDPRYSIVSEAEFDSISFPKVDTGDLHRTLLFLYLYDRGFFELPVETELDRALSR